VADPRADDVAGARRLLDEAAGQGAARLPALSAAELWVLCGDRQVLADDAEARWWHGMTEAERARLARAMLDLLAERGLLRRDGTLPSPAGDGPGAGGDRPAGAAMPLVPEIALIVAARQAPAVVAVATGEGGSAAGAPRLFGLAEGGRPPRVVVAEVVDDKPRGPFGPLHHFSLLSAGRGGHALAAWATEPRAGGRPRRRGGKADASRVIDVYRYTEDEQLDHRRIVVRPDGSGAHEVTRQDPGAGTGPAPAPARTCGTEELAALLAGTLAGQQ